MNDTLKKIVLLGFLSLLAINLLTNTTTKNHSLKPLNDQLRAAFEFFTPLPSIQTNWSAVENAYFTAPDSCPGFTVSVDTSFVYSCDTINTIYAVPSVPSPNYIYIWQEGTHGTGDTLGTDSSLNLSITTRLSLTVIDTSLSSCNQSLHTRVVSIPNAPPNGYSINYTCNLDSARTDTVIFQNLMGCDSLHITQTIYSPTVYTTLYDTLCNDTLYFGGAMVDTTGTYFDTLSSVSTCDSIVILNLYVQKEICGNQIDDDCDGLIDNFDTDDCPCNFNNFFGVCTPDCQYEFIPEPISITSKWVSDDTIANYQTPLAADIDGDDTVEVVMLSGDNLTYSEPRRSQNIHVFNGVTGQKEIKISTPFLAWVNPTPIAIGDIDLDGFAEIIVSTADHGSNPAIDRGVLICYEHDGTMKWRSNAKVGDNAPKRYGSSVNLADFNGDGFPEVYLFNEIYNAQTGEKLADGGNYGIGMMSHNAWGAVSSVAAADLTADEGLELASGNTVYEVEINNPHGMTGNIMRPIEISGFGDGFTAISDVDLDGWLDVVVSTKQNPNLYVWNPRDTSLIASAHYNTAWTGIPFIGDVDSDCQPEIGVSRSYNLFMYEYDSTTTLSLKWQLPTSDESGFTGLTIFDFNQDDKSEIIYRDMTTLRVLDGSGSTPITIANYPCRSGTGSEMPIVVDVDSDNSADIVCGCAVPNHPRYHPGDGIVTVFESDGQPWAPSRKMWNQVSYSVTNINDDLTIPQQVQNNSTIFEDVPCADCDDYRPLNFFLEQSSIYDIEGCKVYPATSDAMAGIGDVTYDCVKDSISIEYFVINIAEHVDAPQNMPVSFYNGIPTMPGATLLGTIKLADGIPALTSTDTFTIKFAIDADTAFNIFVSVNDDGTDTIPVSFPITLMAECGYDNNLASTTIPGDTTPPVIDCNSIISLGTCDSRYWWESPTATDDCTDSTDIRWESNYEPGDSFGVGTNIIMWVAFDQAGNSDTCYQTLVIFPEQETTLNEQICHDDSIGFNGNYYSATGTYVANLLTWQGCDSTVTLNLIVNSQDTTNLTATSCNPADVGIDTVILNNQYSCDSVIITTTTLLPSDTTFLTETSCNPNDTGTVLVTLNNQYGCDSLIYTTTTLLPTDTTNINITTCDVAQVGTVSQTLTNQYGCDSLVITVTTLLPSNTTNLTATTCDPTQAGTTTQILTNQFGCDSTVITVTALLPSNINNLVAASCDSAQVGIDTTVLSNIYGCDSLVITTTTLLPSSETQLTVIVCDSAQIGIDTVTLTNQHGCDSLVITTSLFGADNNVTQLTATSCDVSQVGVDTVTLSGYLGCDSLIITTTSLLPSDTIKISLTSCNPSNVGVVTQTLTNQSGCDSLVIITTTLLPSDTTNLTATTCDASQVGIITQTLTNQFGCDSLVITITTLLPSNETQLTATSCDPAQVGVDTVVLANIYGCDSLVITTTTLLPSNETQLSATSCDASQVGVDTVVLANIHGCDSMVITTSTFVAINNITNLLANTCDITQAGSDTITLTNFYGCDSLVITTTNYTGSSTTNLTVTTCDITQAGSDTAVLTNYYGCDSLVITNTTFAANNNITNLTATSCDINQVGPDTITLSNYYGCDSLVITTTNLLPSNQTQLTATTCDISQAGIDTVVLNNYFGCDSLVITTTTFAANNNITNLTATTCDISQAGIDTVVLNNYFGCDSLIITTTVFAANNNVTNLTATTCDISQAGIDTVVLNNYFGCDSLIITTTNYLQPDTTHLTATSCRINDVGSVGQLFKNQYGCDSLVITTTTLLPTSITNLTATSCNPADVGMDTVSLTNFYGCDSLVITTTTLLASDTTYLNATTCNQLDAGLDTATLTNLNGCDSIIITNTTWMPSDTMHLLTTSCNPADVGVVTQTLNNQYGCDSLVITTTSLVLSDTVNIALTSCNPSDVGVTTQNLTNENGCDSLVITTTTFLPSDTTYLNATTCNPSDAGQVGQLLNNQYGCDSLVITTTVLVNADTTYLANTSCNPSDVGVVTQNLNNYYGCDSLVITTTTLSPSDTTVINTTSCNPNNVGTATQLLTNIYGCDSLVITNTSLANSDTTIVNATSCSPSNVGISTQTLTNVYGCDSLIITNTVLVPSDTIYLSATSCYAGDVGVNTEYFNNQYGCDSLVITTTTLSPSDTTYQTSTSCNPNAVGTSSSVYTNQYGCDSTVISTVTYSPADTVVTTSQTCNPNQAGVTTTILNNQYGCDSIVISETIFVPSDTTYLYSTSCVSADTGIFVLNLTNNNGCDSIVISEVTYVNEGGFTVQDAYICEGESVELNIEGANNPIWTASTTLSCLACDNPVANPTVTTTYTVTVEDCEGNPEQHQITVFVDDAPNIYAHQEDNIIAYGDSTRVWVTSDQIFLSYTWTKSTGEVVCVNCTEAVVNPTETTVYVVTATSDNGCESVDSVKIIVPQVCVDAVVEVPNIITPNNDGFNDNLEIRYQGLERIYLVRIYNRWGQLIFETNDIENRWDATFRGVPVDPAVYVYYLRAVCPDGSTSIYRGNVTVVR
jgi:gliding motility-associated-like protein